MTKIKKALLLALSLVMSASLFAACGKDKGNGGTSSSESSSVESSTPVEDSSEEDSSVEDSSEEESSDEVSSDEASSDEASSDEASSDEVSSDEVSSDEVSSEEESSDEVSSEEESSDEVSSEEESSEEPELPDTTKPVLSAIDETQFADLKVGDKITIPTVTATDDKDGDVTVYVSFGTMMFQNPAQMGDVITFEFAGNYVLKYTAQDAAENVAEKTINITVTCAHEYTIENKDDANHWMECECGEIDQDSVKAHEYTVENKDEKNHWLECECGTIDQDSVTEHEFTVNDTDAETDTIECECGYADPDYSFNKVVTAERQKLNLSDETLALSLEGVSEYSSVVLAMFNDYDLGTDLSALTISDDLKADTASHGEQTIMVIVVDAEGYEHTISVPVFFVTKTLKTAEDLKLLQIQSNTGVVYGHYVLGGDITSNSAIVAPGGWTEGVGETNDGTQGFCGSLDGNGYTITMPAGARGLFGTIGNSVIKNVTFTCTSLDSNQWANTFLARLAVGATFENVTINFSNITKGPKGAIIELATRDCDFINVNINIDGQINNLFGAHTGTSLTQGMNAAQVDYPDTLCTFTSCTINLKKETSTLDVLGQCYNGETYNTYIANGCETTEGITVDGITITSPRPDVKLANQDLLTASETVSLDLGDYAGYTVQSITLDGEDIGTTDVSAITIPAAIKADPTKHGTGSTYTVVVDKDGAPYKIAIPVTFVTDTIATAADFAKVQVSSDSQIINGYYILTADITGGISAGGGGRMQPTNDGEYGFCGTLDGRDYTITSDAINGGLFCALGRGAVIKNTTFTCNSIAQNQWASLLACYAIGATIENCEFNFSGITGADEGKKGLILEMGGRDCAFNNVVINITGAASTLFGGNTNRYLGFNANQGNFWDTKCTFSGCTVNLMTADSSLAMLGEGLIADAAWSTTGTVTQFIADGCTTAAGDTTETVEGITIVKKA